MKVILVSGRKNSPVKLKNFEGNVEDWKAWTNCLTSDVGNETDWETNWANISLM